MAVIRATGAKVATLIQSLHANGVVHGDIKPKNIVRVDRDGNSRVFMQDARFGGPSSLAFGSDSLLAVASYEHSRIVLVNVSTLERRVLRRY